MLDVVLFVVVLWLACGIVTLVHEAGHARVARRAGCSDIFIDVGAPVVLRLPWAATRVTGADDVYVGLWPLAGRTEPGPAHDLQALKLYYRAGWRASAQLCVWASVVCVADTLVVTPPIESGVSAVAAPVAFLALVGFVGNRFCVINPEPGGHHGSDAYHARALAGASFQESAATVAGRSASEVRRSRRGRVVGL